MKIIGHEVELLEDPFGLLQGKRYEYYLNIEVDEEDELYTENGLLLKVIFLVDESESRIMQSYFIEQETEKVLDFELEDDETELVKTYCLQHLPGDDVTDLNESKE